MERDILVDILERKARLLSGPSRGWAEAVSLAVRTLLDGVDGRWAPARVMRLRADLVRAERELGVSSCIL
jgi:hypothetical protein